MYPILKDLLKFCTTKNLFKKILIIILGSLKFNQLSTNAKKTPSAVCRAILKVWNIVNLVSEQFYKKMKANDSFLFLFVAVENDASKCVDTVETFC